MQTEMYLFLATIALILVCIKLFLYNKNENNFLAGMAMIILGLFTQISNNILAGTGDIIGWAGYFFIVIGLFILIKEATGR